MAEKSGQNLTIYEPTASERKLLEALLSPENRLKSVKALCQLLGMSRQAYYNAFNKPAFVAFLNEQSLSLVKQSVAPVLMAFQREAVRGSFQHGKLILQIAGFYVEKREVKVDHPEREFIFRMHPTSNPA